MTAARRLEHDHPSLPSGRVTLLDGDRISVSIDGGGEVLAKRAASCLLAPAAGDRVLLAFSPEPFVLAVLERDSQRPAELRFEGDVELTATGRIAMSGAAGLALRTAHALEMLAEELDVKSKSASVVFKRVSAFAHAATAGFDKLGVVAEAYDLVADRMMARAKRAYRFVEEYEQLRARHIDHRAEQIAQIRGENTVIVARQVAKMDGEQVHIG